MAATVLKYPETCGEDDKTPSWVKFDIYDRVGAATKASPHTTIGLYMPESASMPSTVSWENERLGFRAGYGLGIIGEAVKDSGGIQAIYNNVFDNQNTGGATEFARAMAKASGIAGGSFSKQLVREAQWNIGFETAGKVAKSIVGNQNLDADQIIGAATGTVRNPYLTAMFRGVDFRTFEFAFRMFPHNEKESREIYEIIRAFRSGYLPRYTLNDGSTALLDYPCEFGITYMWGSKPNHKIHKFKNSVLTNFEINYTGNGSWTVMKDGTPASIVISMRFSETSIVTKNDIDLGY